jgi:hypothetical protein
MKMAQTVLQRGLSSTSIRYCWFNGCCINQDNEDEKLRQSATYGRHLLIIEDMTLPLPKPAGMLRSVVVPNFGKPILGKRGNET